MIGLYTRVIIVIQLCANIIYFKNFYGYEKVINRINVLSIFAIFRLSAVEPF